MLNAFENSHNNWHVLWRRVENVVYVKRYQIKWNSSTLVSFSKCIFWLWIFFSPFVVTLWPFKQLFSLFLNIFEFTLNLSVLVHSAFQCMLDIRSHKIEKTLKMLCFTLCMLSFNVMWLSTIYCDDLILMLSSSYYTIYHKERTRIYSDIFWK